MRHCCCCRSPLWLYGTARRHPRQKLAASCGRKLGAHELRYVDRAHASRIKSAFDPRNCRCVYSSRPTRWSWICCHCHSWLEWSKPWSHLPHFPVFCPISVAAAAPISSFPALRSSSFGRGSRKYNSARQFNQFVMIAILTIGICIRTAQTYLALIQVHIRHRHVSK